MSPGRRPPARIRVPPPPDPLPEPLEYIWAADVRLARCHRTAHTSFFPGRSKAPGRFNPFIPIDGTSALPVMYAAGDDDGALSETVFHDVPVRGPGKQIIETALADRLLSTVTASRDLRLADLRDDGLSRLQVSRAELIESDPRSYRETALYSQAVHAHPTRFDGMVWVSRQRATSLAVLLFGDRLTSADGAVALAHHSPRPLLVGHGRNLVNAIAERAQIRITMP